VATTTIDKLRQGDRIRCPHDGQTERVTRVTAMVVRTDRHDHGRASRQPVEIL
jgi:hypothetical protein